MAPTSSPSRVAARRIGDALPTAQTTPTGRTSPADLASSPFWDQFPDGPARALVRAGVETFAAQGFAATTTRDIARAAGLSPAGLYVHYRSKAALLHALSRAGHRAAAAVLEEAMAVELPPRERIARAVGTFAAWHARHHRIARVVQYELGSLEPDAYAEVAALRRGMQRRVVDEISAAVGVGAVDVPDVADVARACLSLSIDVCRWYEPAGPRTPEAIGELYTELTRRWLRPPSGVATPTPDPDEASP